MSTVRPRSPRSWPDSNVVKAFEGAIESAEPIFVPTTWFVDDRGASLMNQLQGVMSPEGQMNYSVQNPGVIKAWHRHHLQTDFWLCLVGHLKVGIHRETDGVSWVAVIGEKKPGVLIIPPPLWHGATATGNSPAGLLYYVTHKYDPSKPDEDRRSHDSIENFPWHVQHC